MHAATPQEHDKDSSIDELLLWAGMILTCFFSIMLVSPAFAASDKSSPLPMVQIQDLVHPVSPCPDILLKNILPAYIFPDQIVDASLLVRDKNSANWGNSGIMSLIDHQDVKLFENNLGSGTAERAASINSFDPDGTWKEVQE